MFPTNLVDFDSNLSGDGFPETLITTDNSEVLQIELELNVRRVEVYLEVNDEVEVELEG